MNGFTDQTGFSSGSPCCQSFIAQYLVNAINQDNPYVTASCQGGTCGTTIVLTAKTNGASTNYSLSASSTYDSADFGQPSFTATASGSALTGGTDGNTVYDSGTVTVTVGSSYTASAPYGPSSNSTAMQVAAALVGTGSSGLNRPGSPVQATANGATVSFTYNNIGASGDVAISASSSPTNSSMFPNGSFSGSTTLGGGQDSYPSGIAHPYVTTYAYDPLNNLTSVTQGPQTRTYTFDGAGRMISSTLPESGTANFTYTDFGGLHTRTDARGVVATYGYDGLNRLTSISYNVGSTGVPATPSVGFVFGTSTSNNNNGRLLQMTDGVGSETYTYDSTLGRLTQSSRVINGSTYNIGYGYNAAGELNSLTYPSGRIVNPGYDAVGRITQVASGGTNYLSGMTFNSSQFPTGFTYGNGVQASLGYNDHLQLSTLSYTSGPNTLLNLTYGYADANGNNNGQIQSINDGRGAAFSTTYTYDTLGRLSQAQTNDLTSANTWRLAWGYDRFGNRLSQTLTGGTLSVGQPHKCLSWRGTHIWPFAFRRHMV